jgi:murein DD-endopeptidase MepM/ murein hydrolase activator NlpD
MVLAAVLSYHFISNPPHAGLITKLQTENSTQQNQIRFFSERIGQVQNRIAEMKEFDSRLRVIANLEHMPSSLFGVGGPLSEDIREKIRNRQAPEPVVGSLESSSTLSASGSCPEDKHRSQSEGLVHRAWSPWPHIPCEWPTQGWVIGGFGCRFSPQTGSYELHEGVEVSNSTGTSVVAPADGLVTTIGSDPTHGKMIVISHGYGVVTRYGHLGEVNVNLGEDVRRGQVIGKIGSTGHSIGPHLYYEVRVNGIPADPGNYL